MASVRILEHRVKFMDGRPDEVNDCRDDAKYKAWLDGKTAAAIVYQATSQQETVTFRVEGGPVKGLTRTNKTSKFFIPMNKESIVMGDFDIGEHSFTFPVQEIQDIAIARAKWSLDTTYHDAAGTVFCHRKSTFEIVGPRAAVAGQPAVM